MNAPRGSSDKQRKRRRLDGELGPRERPVDHLLQHLHRRVLVAEGQLLRDRRQPTRVERPSRATRVSRGASRAASAATSSSVTVGMRSVSMRSASSVAELRSSSLFVGQRRRSSRRQIEQPMAARRALGLVGKVERRIGVARRRRRAPAIGASAAAAWRRAARPTTSARDCASPCPARVDSGSASPALVSSSSRPERVGLVVQRARAPVERLGDRPAAPASGRDRRSACARRRRRPASGSPTPPACARQLRLADRVAVGAGVRCDARARPLVVALVQALAGRLRDPAPADLRHVAVGGRCRACACASVASISSVSRCSGSMSRIPLHTAIACTSRPSSA